MSRETDFMEKPDSWPHLVLPLVRGRDTGVMFPHVDNGGVFKVIKGVNLFGPTGKESETLEYGSAQAVLDAGWRID